MRLKGLDLNLLVALNVLLEERNVSRAAERLHVSQPAASAALRRLRDYFDDELLVLHGIRMIPTSYAQSLHPKIKRILGDLESVISSSAEFDPQQSERNFRLMASDYITTVLLTPLATELDTLAPNICFDIRLPDHALATSFERGEVDLMLVPENRLMAEHPSTLIFEERHVVIGWDQNPLLTEPLTEESYHNATHIGVWFGPTKDPSFTEMELASQGMKRNMSIAAQSFSVVPWFLVGTRKLAVVQERLARMYCSVMPLRTAELPFKLAKMRLMAQYHNSRASDQGLLWLMDQLTKQAKKTAQEIEI